MGKINNREEKSKQKGKPWSQFSFRTQMRNNSYVKVDRQLSHAHILRDDFMNVNSTLEKISVVCYGMSFEDISTWLNELDSIARPPSDAMSSTNNGTKCQSNYLKLQHHFLSYLDSVERFCKHFNGDRIGIMFCVENQDPPQCKQSQFAINVCAHECNDWNYRWYCIQSVRFAWFSLANWNIQLSRLQLWEPLSVIIDWQSGVICT